MSCASLALKGLQTDCFGSKGGIVEVYLTNYVQDTYVIDEETKSAKLAEGKSVGEWYQYRIRPNSSSLNQTLTVANENGISFVTAVLNLVFGRMSPEKRAEMAAIQMSELSFMVKDANGFYHFGGIGQGAYNSNGSGETGVAKTDGNRYSVEITVEEDSYLPFASEELVAAIKEAVVNK